MGGQLRPIRQLARDCDGAAAVLLAISLPPLMGIAALAIDLSSLYLAERRLQGIADAAAAAAVGGDIEVEGQQAAMAVISYAREPDIAMQKFETGRYLPDAAVDYRQRFQPDSPGPNAARIVLSQEVPLFFAPVISGDRMGRVAATATAARSDLVAFDLGTRLLSVSGGIPNLLLSELAGVQLNLTSDQIGQLTTARISIMDFAETLRDGQGVAGRPLGTALQQATPVAQVVDALAASAGGNAEGILLQVARRLRAQNLVLADLIDLGPYAGITVNDGRTDAAVDAYSLLRGILQAANGGDYALDVQTSVAGAASARVRLAGGNSYERSRWLTFDDAGDVILRTAEMRVGVDVSAGLPLVPLASVQLPLLIELAPAEAQISAIDCNRKSHAGGVTIDVRPSVGSVALARYDPAAFNDLSRRLLPQRAAVVKTALLSLNGISHVPVGGVTTQKVHFSFADVERDVRKEAGTIDMLTAITRAAVTDVDYELRLLGLGLPIGLNKTQLTSAVAGVATGLAPGVDALVNQVLAAAGVKLGVAEVGVIDLRCGHPAIVG